MPLQISFELSDKDLEYFKNHALTAQSALNQGDLSREAIVASTRAVFEASKDGADLPEFISVRLAKLETLVDMVTNTEWQLPDDEMNRVYSAMAYFANPDDLIPDRIPGIGFLDDAIMVELMVDDLQDEIEAYHEFCQYRAAEADKRAHRGQSTDISKEDWLADQRAVLHHRMRTRRANRSRRLW